MLFELLTRQITSDILSEKDSVSVEILRKFFAPKTELYKEYSLYRTLAEESFSSESRCMMLIESVIKARRSIDKVKLKEEKYQLIKELANNYDVNVFFQTKVRNYKLLASIYKILEYTELDNPSEITRSKVTIVENMMNPNSKLITGKKHELEDEPKEIRVMTYKIMIQRFNEKYGELTDNQKEILKEYIENVSSTTKLKHFLEHEANKVREIFQENLHTLTDKVLKIKLTEITSLLDKYENIKKVDESHVVSLLRYYDIIDDLGWSS